MIMNADVGYKLTLTLVNMQAFMSMVINTIEDFHCLLITCLCEGPFFFLMAL